MGVALERVLARLTGVKPAAGGWVARCPAHEDHVQSLQISEREDASVGVWCHASCPTSAVLAALDLRFADLYVSNNGHGTKQIVAEYPYHDEAGTHLYDVVRFEPKDFRLRRADGLWKLTGVRRVLFGLPGLQGQPIVLVAEGEECALALRAIGLVATTSPLGAGKWRPAYAEQLRAAGATQIVVLPDNDSPGKAHAAHVAASCRAAGLSVQIIELPGLSDHGDVVNWLAAGGTKEQLDALIETAPIDASDLPVPPLPAAPPTPRTLAEVDSVFARWLGDAYDLDALHAVLAAAAAERLRGDPLWLLVVSGSGNAKTETVQALVGGGAIVTSTISSDGALLSATARRDRTKDATGGLLRRLGDRGLLVVKDVTSILAMNRDTRASLLAALREIHDGKWERNVGTDGGRSLAWTGRLVLIGAVTTAWDRAHDVIASMGDRFVVVRMDSTVGRLAAGRRACQNTGNEDAMRSELAEVVGGLLATVDPDAAITLPEPEQEQLLAAADVVTLARTGVEYDYRGDVIDAHAPEMPTRFAKQLTQLARGAVAIGLARAAAVRLALRCARDSMPPLRLAILEDVATHPGTRSGDVRRRLDKPWSTVDRQLQALHILGVLTCDELEEPGRQRTVWRYRVADHIKPSALPNVSPDLSPHAHTRTQEEGSTETLRPTVSLPSDISGDAAVHEVDAEPLTESELAFALHDEDA